MRKGDIYLADLGKSRNSFEFGKNRPVLIVQSDKLNFAVEAGIYEHFLVCPLSTKDDYLTREFRPRISARDELEKDSFIVCSSVCFLHKNQLIKKIATIGSRELKEIDGVLKNIFDLEDEG